MPEIIPDECTHQGTVSFWDGRATTLCGKTLKSGSYKRPWFNGGADCEDCRKAKTEGTKL
ncbi:hypothetical protein EIL87_01110 [Saccharopolyspora rhizosphaerae]|uniref:Uncharacterized protein n=1 Tax=Saccharopolyspora rhizosphaerae TaxID=2492662 RepID=A0A426K548_9PSEU|nr:hypothetical protein [Saccharopolyspora rhizosphaerae]RRO20523.1 hypothetical protein EIL87_01110 [Saccharopolyspora rhizosphaerae]